MELAPSKRGWNNVRPDLMIDPSRQLAENEYHPSKNPTGIIDLGSAINQLMQKDLGQWVSRRLENRDVTEVLQYNDTQGSPGLLQAVAGFMNRQFHCKVPLESSNILAANGVTTLLNSLAYSIADEDCGILLPTPSYGMFAHDTFTRNSVRLVHVPCDDIQEGRFGVQQGTSGHRWRSELVRRLETALRTERKSGRCSSAVLLANPENTLARCYHREVLLEVSQFCAENGLHLVLDEIYAGTGQPNFQSILSLDLGPNRANVHVLWGMSKDFGCGGLRLGFLATYNQRVYDTMRTLSMFGWISAWSADVATEILADSQFLNNTYFPKLRKRLAERRRLVLDQLGTLNVPFSVPNAGFFVFVDLSQWLDKVFCHTNTKSAEIDLLQHMMKHRVFMEPGKAFFSVRPGWFCLNFGGDGEAVSLGLARLAQALSVLDLRARTDEEEDALFEKLGAGEDGHGRKRRRRWEIPCFRWSS